MFYDASSFNQDVSGWDSAVTGHGGVFKGATSLNGNSEHLGRSGVRFMRRMFKRVSSFNQDIALGRGW